MNQESTLAELDQLKRAVMRRVYVICFFRRLTQSVLIKLSILIFLLGGIFVSQSPRAVWHNIQIAGGLTNYHFFVSTLANTETTVQFSLLAIGLIGFWLTRNFWLNFWSHLGRFSFSSLTGFFFRVRS
ncbi:MAG: hypothetical protein AAB677_03420 [Patescibacteria group bacterium]